MLKDHNIVSERKASIVKDAEGLSNVLENKLSQYFNEQNSKLLKVTQHIIPCSKLIMKTLKEFVKFVRSCAVVSFKNLNMIIAKPWTQDVDSTYIRRSENEIF